MSRILSVEEAQAVAILADAAEKLYATNSNDALASVQKRIEDATRDLKGDPAKEANADGTAKPLLRLRTISARGTLEVFDDGTVLLDGEPAHVVVRKPTVTPEQAAAIAAETLAREKADFSDMLANLQYGKDIFALIQKLAQEPATPIWKLAACHKMLGFSGCAVVPVR